MQDKKEKVKGLYKDTYTLREFIEYLNSLRDELKDIPIYIVSENKMTVKPTVKLYYENQYNLFTQSPPDKLIITES